VFLPPLLFSAAWQTSWREFKYNIVSIGLLAVGLVFFTALGVALTAHFFFDGFDWRLGFLLGAVVSPTDAVAATSIARKVGMPDRIVDILEGESLMNDATGLLALQFGLQMVESGTTPTIGHGVLEFLWLVAGGAGMGLLIGAIVNWVEQWVNDAPVEIAISVITAYASYIGAEAIHASGVISTVVCGLYLSRKSSRFFSADVRLQTEAVWDALEFLLNGLVFILIGLQLPYVLEAIRGESPVRVVEFGLAFAGLLILLRLVWVYPGAWIAWELRTHGLHQHYEHPTVSGTFVLGWTGMRGVLSLAAASSLPLTLADGRPFPQRNLILFLTFAVILVTLVLQGFSLPMVVRWLGLSGGGHQGQEELDARCKLLQTAIVFLEEEKEQQGEGSTHAYDDLLHDYRHRLAELKAVGGDEASEDVTGPVTRDLMLQSLRRQRAELEQLRDSGRIGDATHRVLERELDFGESQLELEK
jgi:monovalent cation/hydrogen antiporter